MKCVQFASFGCGCGISTYVLYGFLERRYMGNGSTKVLLVVAAYVAYTYGFILSDVEWVHAIKGRVIFVCGIQ